MQPNVESLTLELLRHQTMITCWENVMNTISTLPSVKKLIIAYVRPSHILGKAPPPTQTTPLDFMSPEVLDAITCIGRCLPYLSTMSSLRALHIYIASDNFATFLSTDSRESDFLNLTDVYLVSDDPRRCFELLRPGF